MEKEQIAARLDSVTLPISSLDVQTQLVGIYCPPQEWKTTDELNPNVFTYTVRFMNQQFVGGKVNPRDLTQKQIRQQEQNTKKKAPPGKKETKDPAEEERIRKIKQQEALAEAKRAQQEAKLSEQQRLYLISQDPQRAFSLKFENKNFNANFQGNLLVIFEERVNSDGGEWVYVYKHPSISQQQLAKMRKGKPKNLNLNDLNPVVLRGWLDLSKFRESGVSEKTLRCKLSQVEQTPETSKPNTQKTYIKLKLKLSQSINKQTNPQNHIQSTDLILPIPPPTPIPADIQSVNEFQEQIKVILQSIAMQFSESHSQQLNTCYQQKASEPLYVIKQADKTKRAEQFLYEFNVKGMYKIMKQRVKKVIVKICKNKFKQQLKQYSSFTGITTQSKDQFYSQIYSFLIKQYQLVLKQVIQEKKQDLYLTPVQSQKVFKNDMDKYIKKRINETESQKIIRLTKQHQALRNLDQAKLIFQDAIRDKKQGEGLDLKLEYVKFCLKNNLTNSSKLVKIVYEVLQGNKQDSEIYLLYTLLLFSSKKKHEYKKGWVFLRELIQKDPHNKNYLLIAKIVFQNCLVDQKLAEKYYRLASRVVMRQIGLLNQQGQHQSNPSPSELPTLKAGCQYNVELNPQQIDKQLYSSIISVLSKYSLFDLIQYVLQKVNNRDDPTFLYTSILAQLNKSSQKALQLAFNLAAKYPEYNILKLITQISYQSGNYQMCQQYLKKLFRFKQTVGNASTYLQLASIYYKKNQILNSKACLVKLIQSDKNNSLCWLMLGNVQFKLNNIDSSINCLRQANILNPSNHQIWYSLCEIYLQQKKMNIANSCLVNSIKLRRNKQYGFGQSLRLYIKGSTFQNKNDQQIAELILDNLKMESSDQ